mmetsp:Transcript_51100/g.102635  ORF Transcript_51100/g.102635 Transcript_51100/m.102635 type:complete len:130 (+) Transcript_51100:18-407(+)
MDRSNLRCSVCQSVYPYDYFGRRPPYAPSYTFLEDAYLLKDPFTDAATNGVVCVGSRCGACATDVCASAECSIFYSSRLCARCINSEPYRLSEKLPRELGPQLKALKKEDDMPAPPESIETQSPIGQRR